MSASLEPLEEKIIRFIHYNAGCSKSDIVRFLDRINAASRLTVLTYLDRLESKQIIKFELEKPNSQTYKIYINKDNILASLFTDLEDFERAYVNLLEKIKRSNKEQRLFHRYPGVGN